MADIRINSLPTTASASSSDDFLALDGATNGTRKLNAYSPTFGGSLTVNGAINAVGQSIVVSPSSGTAKGRINSDPFRADVIQVGSNWTGGAQDDATKPSWYWFFDSRAAGDSATLFRVPPGGSPTSALAISSTAATLAGNLTVSGGLLTLNNATESYVELKIAGTTKGYLDQLPSTLNVLGMSGVDVDIYAGGNNPANRVAKFAASGIATTLYGNLTVSGGTITSGSGTLTLNSSANTVVLQSAGTTALTLDSSQRAQFAGNIGLGSAPVANLGIRNSLSLTASGGSAYAYQAGGTLTTAANNDTIFGMAIDNGYSNTGSYTNVSAGHLSLNARSFSGLAFGYGLRIGNITGATSNYAIRTGSGIVSFEDTTASTSTTTGAMIVSGGVGVAGAVNVGGAISIGNTVNTVSPTSPNRTITMVIGGTTYYIHAKTTND